MWRSYIKVIGHYLRWGIMFHTFVFFRKLTILNLLLNNWQSFKSCDWYNVLNYCNLFDSNHYQCCMFITLIFDHYFRRRDSGTSGVKNTSATVPPESAPPESQFDSRSVLLFIRITNTMHDYEYIIFKISCSQPFTWIWCSN